MASEDSGGAFKRPPKFPNFRGWAWLILPFVLVGAVHLLTSCGWLGGSSQTGAAQKVLYWFQVLPTQPAFYYLMAAFALLYTVRRRMRRRRFQEQFDGKERPDKLTAYDWLTARSLRERAFNLRERADLLLGGVFALLFSSLYTIGFVVPWVAVSDLQIEGEVNRAVFSEKFGHQLENVAKGEHWFQVEDLGLAGYGSVTVLEFSPDGKHGVVGTSNGLVYLTGDGGESWAAQEGLAWQEAEWPVGAAFGDAGPQAIWGDEGSVYVRSAEGKGWGKPKGLALDYGDITVAEFSPDGEHGVVGTRSGLVYLTGDGGENWAAQAGLAWREAEWPVGAAFGKVGPQTIWGDKGSVYVRSAEGKAWGKPKGLDLDYSDITVAEFSPDGKHGVIGGVVPSVYVTKDSGKSWGKPKGLDLDYSDITLAEFSPDGKRGVVGTRNGLVYLTGDGGESWAAQEGLAWREAEWPVGVAFGEAGPQTIWGDKGSVYVSSAEGKAWGKPNGLDLDYSDITVAEFSPDGEHGVVGTSNGLVYLTGDSGESWAAQEGLAWQEAEWPVGVAFGEAGPQTIWGDEGSVYVRSAEGKAWGKLKDLDLDYDSVTVLEFSPDGKRGVVGTSNGLVYLTGDGGENWAAQAGLAWREAEWPVGAAFGKVGPQTIWGDKGSVYVRSAEGKAWGKPKGLDLDYSDITVAEFSPDGKRGVVGTRNGLVYLTRDSGENWKRGSGELKEG